MHRHPRDPNSRTAAGFDVWFERVSMPSRSLTFHQEIRDAVAMRDRLVLVVGPKAAESLSVRQEWQFADFEAEKIVTPILHSGD
jgi:TIR domain